MKITWSCYMHPFSSMGVIAINVCRELNKLGYDVSINALNAKDQNFYLESFPQDTQEFIQKGFREDSLGIFFAYPDIYPSVKCKVNVGYTGADTSGWYVTTPEITPAQICNKYMDYMLTPSRFSMKYMIDNGVKKEISVFPHGVDLNIFRSFIHHPNKQTNKKIFNFLYVGELSKRKGTQDLIETFIKTFGFDPNVKLILRANTHMLYYGGEEIRKLCENRSNIELNWVDAGQENVAEFYKKADMYVYPTKADWFGMTPMEALASNIPVIATDSGGYIEFLKDCIIPLKSKLVNIENNHPYMKGKWFQIDKEELSEKMKYVVENKREICGCESWKYSNILKNYTWEKVTKDYLVPFLEEVKSERFTEKYKSIEKKETKMNKRVTVGIPTKDRPVELSLLLNSLLDQTYKDFDVIIVNDCHTNLFNENTTVRALINLLMQAKHGVEVIEGDRKGPHYGGQRILENSKNDIILRLDDDVALRPTFIENLIKHFDDPKVAAVGPIYLNPHEIIKNQIIDPKFSYEDKVNMGKVYWDENGMLFLTGYNQCVMHPDKKPIETQHLNSGFMYRKSVAKEIGEYCLDLSIVGHREESDFSYRMFHAGYKLLIEPNSIAMHYHPMIGGIRETKGTYHGKDNWDHDERIFIQRMEKILPRSKEFVDKTKVGIVLLTSRKSRQFLQILEDINKYTNHPHEIAIINNDEEQLEKDVLDKILKYQTVRFAYTTEKHLSVSEARNIGYKSISKDIEYICFIDDDARILGRYNQNTDWLDFLYQKFNSEPDVGAVGPILTWFSLLQSYVLSVSCLFTSRKVLDVVGLFDNNFGNKAKGTWGYEDVDWSYRVIQSGFKLKGVEDNYFPFYHEDTTNKEKADWQEEGLIKAYDILKSKYDIEEINKYCRTVYPFTDLQMEYMTRVKTKLNIGCFYMYLEGWTNIDINSEIPCDKIMDMRDIKKNYLKDTVDIILISQVLEHINKEDGIKSLVDIHSVLKQGGHLIVEVPDCGDLEERLKKGEINESELRVAKEGTPSFPYQVHEAEYTETELREILEGIGFYVFPRNIISSDMINAIRFDCIKR